METIACYICNGPGTPNVCGLPLLGCPLCKAYGTGCGRLFPERLGDVTSWTIDGRTYTVPTVCRWCKGKKVEPWETFLSDPRIRGNPASDGRDHSQPKVLGLPCSHCCESAHKDALAAAQAFLLTGHAEPRGTLLVDEGFKWKDQSVPCYNCVPEILEACPLCNGKGMLKRSVCETPQVVNGETYARPMHDCLWCSDTGITTAFHPYYLVRNNSSPYVKGNVCGHCAKGNFQESHKHDCIIDAFLRKMPDLADSRWQYDPLSRTLTRL